MPFDVFLYNIPKVTDDGKDVVPVAGSETQGFSSLEEAKQFAADKKQAFDRVVLMRTDDEGVQQMVERYLDGEHELGKASTPEAGTES